jgi:LysM repeat protein
MAQRAPRSRRPGRILARLLAPLLLLGVAAAVVLIVRSPPGFLRTTGARTHAAAAVQRRLPPYWRVRSGDSFAVIAARTGLTVDQLQAYNPNVDPLALTPGERLNLWQHPPKPHVKRKPPGPMFWTVRSGQSYGSIAAATGINIVTLEQLNPGLKPASVQPGNRVRLRR